MNDYNILGFDVVPSMEAIVKWPIIPPLQYLRVSHWSLLQHHLRIVQYRDHNRFRQKREQRNYLNSLECKSIRIIIPCVSRREHLRIRLLLKPTFFIFLFATQPMQYNRNKRKYTFLISRGGSKNGAKPTKDYCYNEKDSLYDKKLLGSLLEGLRFFSDIYCFNFMVVHSLS